MKLRTRILLTAIGLSLAGIVLVGVLSAVQIRDYLEERQERELVSLAGLIGGLAGDGSVAAGSESSDTLLHRLASSLGVRISLIRSDGAVVFDSALPRSRLGEVANHADRPEVKDARATGFGKARRWSETSREELVYIVRPVAGAAPGAMAGGFVRVALPAKEVDALDERIRTIVALVAGGSLLLLLLVGFQISKRISRPVTDIVATAQAIKEGDLTQRIPVTGNDEMASLSTAINDMAEKLGADIERLRKLERVRSEFLGNVSHELRTPIFSIQGFLETLLDGAMDDPAVNRDFLEKAYSHASRLNTLLSDLIEISRIESGDMKMSFRYFPVADFIRQAADEMRPAAERKNLHVEIELAVDPDEKVYGDRERLKQVVINLVDNAVKYTDPGGAITVAARYERNAVRIDVRDTGAGIAEEHLPRIFERFYRVDRDRSREVGGTGLGLAIVKHIVEAHGGVMRVESEPGRGSTFSFTLKR